MPAGSSPVPERAQAPIGLVWATPAGAALAAHLARAWPDARAYPGGPRTALRAAWAECDAVVAFMAAGIALRLAAPLLGDKRRDPGLVCVDDAGRFAVALAGGHAGGANRLAARVARTLGATPVVTTASDALGHPALDDLGADLGFRIEPGADLAAVGAAIAAGGPVTLVADQRWPLPPMPAAVIGADVANAPCLLITDRVVDPPRPAVVYRPPSLVVGVGCSRGAPAAEILQLVDRALCDAGLVGASVAGLVSVDAKRHEPGLLQASRERGWALRFHPAERLASVPVPNPSAAVARAVGTASVAEAAALAEAAELVVPKRKSARATVAVARARPRGRLYLVGTGPGDAALVTPQARAALARCELVVGLDRYVDRVRELLRPGTRVEVSAIGGELERARLALAEARRGAAVALVSGGDAGVYGMASPALAEATGDVDVIGVPGVTAALAGAALLGAPLGHDHCAISLSDLLTPWAVISRRLEAAARGDFVISLYNPRSAGRSWQLEEARRLLLRHRGPDTPVGLVTDAYRPGQRVELTTLGRLDVASAGMTTTVMIGSSQTRVVAGRMVTPRGYPHDGDGARPAAEGPGVPTGRSAHPIETESYRILRSMVDLSHLGPLSRAVAERVIHASADTGYGTDLLLDEAALEAGLAALRSGAPVVVDARMVAAAITAREVVCALDLAGESPDPGSSGGGATRSAAGVRAAAARVGPGAVWVIGCAPSALAELLRLRAGPALVIGLPVGFVGAVEAKRALAASGLPALTNRGVKGGSAVAAAALNALLYREDGT
jgi:cobalt-precorrin 5A hydrolase / precorrin-3B C17-methyltransferase